MVYGGYIEFTVAAGASIEIYVNYSADFQVEGKSAVKGLTSELGQSKFTYTFNSETTVKIYCDTDSSGDNYFYTISITY